MTWTVQKMAKRAKARVMGKAAGATASARGRVEGLDGLLIYGWASLAGAGEGDEEITLWAQGAQLDAAVVRVEREDVRQAIEGAALHSGFEIEVPSQLWRDAPLDAQLELQVRVNDLPVASGIDLRLSRATLHKELAELQMSSAEVGELGVAEVQKYQYRLLAAIEHALLAGVLPQLSPDLQAFVQAQGERFGVKFDAAADDGTALQHLDHDIALITLWRAQREFNVLCGEDGDLARALERTLETLALGEGVTQWFLQSLIPWFSGHRQYAALRPHLDVAALKLKANETQAWAISLALPEYVAAADFPQASQLVRRLMDASGWLNTECVAQAAWDLVRHGQRHPLSTDPGKELLLALVALLEQIASDPWGRSHDEHLIDTQVSLITLMPVLPADVATEVLDKALRHYGLVPGFWRRLQARWPEGVAQPARLSSAQRVMSRLQELLRLGSEDRLVESNLDLALASLRGGLIRWHPDAWQIAREIILALRMTPGPSSRLSRWIAELEGMAPEEMLRLAAHPLTESQADLPTDSLTAAVRSCTGSTPGPLSELTWAAWRKFRSASAHEGGRGLPTMEECRRLNVWDTHFVGSYLGTLRLALLAEQDLEGCGRVPEPEVAELRGLWMQAWQQRSTAELPAAPLLGALSLVQRLLRHWPAQSGWRALAADWGTCLTPEWLAALEAPPIEELRLQSPSWLQDTLVVVYSCRANLDSRVRAIRDSWGRTLTAHGVPWVVLVGGGDGRAPTSTRGDVLALDVSDTYECLPDKTLALMAWVGRHTDFAYLYKIDDDCHLDVASFLDRSLHRCHHYMGRPLWRGIGGTDRSWHQTRSASVRGGTALDKSPEPSVYADGGSGYFVSRPAMRQLTRRSATHMGARLRLASFMEDKLVGDLLAACGFRISEEGYETLVRRRFGPGATPVNAYQNTFLPGRSSPTWVTHLDESESQADVEAGLKHTALRPPRLWPTFAKPVLRGVAGTNQLELLSAPSALAPLAAAPVIVVAVARNEMTLMPHFLAHYRALGVQHFVLVDNLSNDGTREYLLSQPDVVLYSADTEYRHSHYGVAWQRAVLGAHALGRWVVLADIDELLIYEDCENRHITEWLAELDGQGHDAALAMMVDMYPRGDLADADFSGGNSPFEIAPYYDVNPLVRWRLGAGNYSNGPTFLSALRHRLIPDSAPNLYTSQKVAVFRYSPWVRLAQGLHYASNLNVAPEPAVFAHFKYHAGFQRKVQEEVARKQHFNGAEEYRKYLSLLSESQGTLWKDGVSRRYHDSRSLLKAATGQGSTS